MTEKRGLERRAESGEMAEEAVGDGSHRMCAFKGKCVTSFWFAVSPGRSACTCARYCGETRPPPTSHAH